MNAAGAWAQEVGVRLGVDTPILPQRHEAVSIHLPRRLDYMMPEVMDYAPAEGRSGLYFRHETFDMFLGGLHSEEAVHPVVDPDDWFEGVEQSYLEQLSELLPHRLPSLADIRLGQGLGGALPGEPRRQAAGRTLSGGRHGDRRLRRRGLRNPGLADRGAPRRRVDRLWGGPQSRGGRRATAGEALPGRSKRVLNRRGGMA